MRVRLARSACASGLRVQLARSACARTYASRRVLSCRRRLWLKLAANAVLNPLTALWDVQNGEVLRRPKGREISQSVCEELWSVMQDQAISPLAHEITVGDLTDFVSECAEANALNYSSMCMDVRNGRRTEIEQLNGWIERLSHTLHEGGKPLSTAKHWLGKNAELAAAIRRRGDG
jgi:2-dehydropantoate 2-reductase